jgi:hypothetical protein
MSDDQIFNNFVLIYVSRMDGFVIEISSEISHVLWQENFKCMLPIYIIKARKAKVQYKYE